MNLRTVWMFSGQGAQYFQMGAPLDGAEPVFRATFDECSRRLKPALGAELREIVYAPRADRFAPFERTLHTHAALFAVQFALAQTLRERGHRPDFVLGYSLGEFVAAAVAGCLSLDDALRAVVEHARAIEAHAPEGAMLAVVDRMDVIDRFPAEFGAVEVAAENYAGHFAVAGPRPAIERLHATLRAAGVNSAPLPVRYAFHSRGIAAAAPAFQRLAATLAFRPPQVPLVSAERARVLRRPTGNDLWRVTAQRVRCRETIEVMEDYGPFRYLDLGPSGTLANFVKYNLRPHTASQVHAIMTPFQRDVESLAAAERALGSPPAAFPP